MNGTLLCGVDGSEGGRRALDLAVELSDQVGLRLVVASIAEVAVRFGTTSVAMEEAIDRERAAAERRLEALLRAHDIQDLVERRIAVGNPACRLAELAAEEAAALIVIGASRTGRARRRIRSSVADLLGVETSIPVLVAVPRIRARRRRVAVATRG